MITGIGLIARNEFSNIVRNPVIIIIAGFLTALIIINALGCHYLLPLNKSFGFNSVFLQGWMNIATPTMEILTILSLCIGIVSVARERSKNTLRMLIVKPVYRRDIITGKLMGIAVFLVLFNILIGFLNISAILISYGGPDSITEIIEIGISTVIISIYCSLTSGIMILFALVFKGLAESLIFAISYMYLTWYNTYPEFMTVICNFFPRYLCGSATIGSALDGQYDVGSVLMFSALLLAEAIIIFLADCAVFNFEEM